ncbi:unnamed protein product, partial [Closterium sp. Yama58-4]
MGQITVELYHKHAPKTCRNFLELSRRGYYNGTKFHRVNQGLKYCKCFAVDGGDPTGTGRGGESIYGSQRFNAASITMLNRHPGNRWGQLY